MDFVGTGTRLSSDDIANMAQELNVEEAALRAIVQVETGGRGFDTKNRPKALFERHIFYRQLASDPELQANAVAAGLAYPKWGEKPYPKDSDGVYNEISAACDIDLEKALRSASWGLGQIMGSNHKMVGFDSAVDMVQDAMKSETNQLKQWAAFIKSANLLDELQRKDWAGFAKGYNGPAYAQNQYDLKLAAAYEKFA